MSAPDLSSQLPGLMAAFVAAALVGYACIHFLLAYLRQRSLKLFYIYCASFSLISLLVLGLR